MHQQSFDNKRMIISRCLCQHRSAVVVHDCIVNKMTSSRS